MSHVVIINADVMDGLAQLPNESIDCVVTSPPYYGLRRYLPDDHPDKAKELGMEPTMAEHIENMVVIFREVRRVLKNTGTVWLNYGDCYATAPNGRSAAEIKKLGTDNRTFRDKPFSTIQGNLKPKDLMMIPNRLAIALQDDGWWVRSEIIFAKPNPMPESVTDRPSCAHEKIFLLTKSRHYFYNEAAVRTPIKESSARRYESDIENQAGSDRANGGAYTIKPVGGPMKMRKTDKQRGHGKRHAGFNDRWDAMSREEQQANGATMKNVWWIPTMGFSDAHFATFPPALVEPCIKAGTADKVCSVCGAPYRPIVNKSLVPTENAHKSHVGNDRAIPVAETDRGGGMQKNGSVPPGYAKRLEVMAWEQSCACEGRAGQDLTESAMVLDPFGGSGTTGLVAANLGRNAFLIELNADYAIMACNRINGQKTIFHQKRKGTDGREKSVQMGLLPIATVIPPEKMRG